VRIVMDHRVEVSQEQQTALAAAAEPADQVEGMGRRRALHPLDLGLGWQKCRRQRHAFLRALDVAGRRRHGHQRLQLALGRERHAGGGVDHSSGAWKWWAEIRSPVLK
jgi:hypothetical protein